MIELLVGLIAVVSLAVAGEIKKAEENLPTCEKVFNDFAHANHDSGNVPVGGNVSDSAAWQAWTDGAYLYALVISEQGFEGGEVPSNFKETGKCKFNKDSMVPFFTAISDMKTRR